MKLWSTQDGARLARKAHGFGNMRLCEVKRKYIDIIYQPILNLILDISVKLMQSPFVKTLRLFAKSGGLITVGSHNQRFVSADEWAHSRRIRDLEEQLGSLKESIAKLGMESTPRFSAIESPGFAGDFIGFAATPQTSRKSEAPQQMVKQRENPAHLVRAAGVRERIRQRRLRESLFSADLFADPAWDMLLDLYAAELEGREVSVSSLCIAAAVPTTTALRWIKLLSQRGWLARAQDPSDGRRINMHLSNEARARLDRYFEGLGNQRS